MKRITLLLLFISSIALGQFNYTQVGNTLQQKDTVINGLTVKTYRVLKGSPGVWYPVTREWVLAQSWAISRVTGLQDSLTNKYSKSDANNRFVHLTGDETIAGFKTFTNTLFTPSIVSSAVVSAQTGFRFHEAITTSNRADMVSLATAASPVTYTFKAASGTVAFVSDIPTSSTYVDLTSAQTITGLKTFNNNFGALFENSINIKPQTTSFFTTGYGGISLHDANKFRISTLNGSTLKSSVFDFSPASTTRTYTFQNADGIVAHTDGTGATGTWPISVTGNAATVTTNANLTGDITSVGNATTYNSIVPSTKGGSGVNNAGTLTWGSGGTLGSNAYTSTAYLPLTAGASFPVGDLYTNRGNATGFYYMGNQSGGARYIGYDGTRYELGNAGLLVGGALTGTSATFTDATLSTTPTTATANYDIVVRDNSGGVDNGKLKKIASSELGVKTNTGVGDNLAVRWDGASGTLIQASNVTIEDSGNIITSGTVTATNLSYQLKDFYTDASNSGSSETDLYVYSVPANRLANNGDKISFTYSGRTASNANTKQLLINFGSNGFGLPNNTANGKDFTLTGTIIRTSSSECRIYFTQNISGESSQSASTTFSTMNFTIANNLKFSATGTASSDITAKTGTIEFKPAAP